MLYNMDGIKSGFWLEKVNEIEYSLLIVDDS